MSTVPLPADPDLAQLKRQAKELQRAVRAGDEIALLDVRTRHPRGSELTTGDERAAFPLSAAQLVLARRYGFTSWAKLRAHLEVVREHSRVPDRRPPSDDPADELLWLACLHYDDDDDGGPRFAEARAFATAHPELVDRSAAVAAALAAPGALAALLAADPGAATREAGPLRWPPLLYLAYSRAIPRDVAEDDVLDTARLLLDHGADPDSGYLWHGLPSPFTALTGCFGEGELGPERQPRHPHGLALARLLLERGADANDSQTLYNRQFFADDSHLELLFAFGLGRGDGGTWKRRLGPALQSPDEMVTAQLRWAVTHHQMARVRLLAANGVDLARPFTGGHSATDLATLAGDTAMAALLRELGAPPTGLDPLGRLVGALLAADTATVDELLTEDATLVDQARAARPALTVWAAGRGRPDAVALLLDHGFDIDALGRSDIPSDQPWETPLHAAVGNGDRPMIELLLARGADPTVRDRRFDATAADWANHFGQDELAALVATEPTDQDAGGAGGGGSETGG